MALKSFSEFGYFRCLCNENHVFDIKKMVTRILYFDHYFFTSKYLYFRRVGYLPMKLKIPRHVSIIMEQFTNMDPLGVCSCKLPSGDKTYLEFQMSCWNWNSQNTFIKQCAIRNPLGVGVGDKTRSLSWNRDAWEGYIIYRIPKSP